MYYVYIYQFPKHDKVEREVIDKLIFNYYLLKATDQFIPPASTIRSGIPTLSPPNFQGAALVSPRGRWFSNIAPAKAQPKQIFVPSPSDVSLSSLVVAF